MLVGVFLLVLGVEWGWADERVMRTQGAVVANLLWPNCVIPYQEWELDQRTERVVREGMAMWKKAFPAITFRRYAGERHRYVRFQVSKAYNGGSSHLGMQEVGKTIIRVGKNCGAGCVAHEIAHTMGMMHEHSRNDRDQFVTVHMDRVGSGHSNMRKYTSRGGQDLLPYDYKSIMHYSEWAFKKDGAGNTIDAPVPIGQREYLSKTDIAAMRFLYNNCRTPTGPPKCVSTVEKGEVPEIQVGQEYVVTFVAVAGELMKVEYVGLPRGARGSTSSLTGGEWLFHQAGMVAFTPTATGRYTYGMQFTTAKGTTRCQVTVRAVRGTTPRPVTPAPARCPATCRGE
eukprot:Sspe_Gene.10980::Locus_3701_Transcript_4_5_Confidence_0.333_Length_1096::g.10980::m.10980